MTSMVMIALFWVFFVLAIYPYTIYPLLLAIASLGAPKSRRDDSFTPSVSVVIAAWNEEALIARRLDNLLASDYPSDRLEVIVASDGSTDDTNEIVANYAARDDRVRLVALQHQGLSSTINAGVAAATGDVVIRTDAGTVFAEDTIRVLASYFTDDSVRCVVGNLTMVPLDDAPYNLGEKLYWRYEAWLRYIEGRARVGFVGCGPCMAIRRECYPELPTDGSEDLSASLPIAQNGGRVIRATDAKASDYMDGGTTNQWRSRRRRVVRALRVMSNCSSALNPLRHPGMAFSIISHKMLRWLIGIWMLGMLATSAWLWSQTEIPVYDVLFAAQVAFYLFALFGYLLSGTRLGKTPVFSVPLAVCVVALAFLAGISDFMRGRNCAAWQPTASDVLDGTEVEADG